ncbi:MAG: PadR family transcriptional regulator [Erysipelotrichales bacterium]
MNSQFKKGIIELCVLQLIKRKDMYGYQVVEELDKYINVSVNTIYPILRRLTNEGYLATYESDEDGRKRKFYTISMPGHDYFNKNYKEWKEFNEKVLKIFEEGDNNGEK